MANEPHVALPALRWTGVCIDSADADEMAVFYGRQLGWELTDRDGRSWVATRDPAGGTGLLFQAEPGYRAPVWPEQPNDQDKTLHLEIKVDDLDSALAHAVASGARVAEYQPQPGWA